MKVMLKINRISAWILLVSIILYMLTGFDMQRRLVVPQLSTLIHIKYLFIPAEVAFAFHSTYAIHLALKRWRLWDKAIIVIITLYIVANAALIIYYFSFQF